MNDAIYVMIILIVSFKFQNATHVDTVKQYAYEVWPDNLVQQ